MFDPPGTSVKIDPLSLDPERVIDILEDEAARATEEAEKTAAAAINDAAPVDTGELAKSHVPLTGDRYPPGIPRVSIPRVSIPRVTGRVEGGVARIGAWHGRFIEKGRPAGVDQLGRRIGQMDPEPFVEDAAASVAEEVEETLLEGGERAAERIEAEIAKNKTGSA